jgi:hypothetical protein
MTSKRSARAIRAAQAKQAPAGPAASRPLENDGQLGRVGKERKETSPRLTPPYGVPNLSATAARGELAVDEKSARVTADQLRHRLSAKAGNPLRSD